MSLDPKDLTVSTSRSQVLLELQKGPKRFKDLEERTSLSTAALNNTIKKLVAEKKIEKIIHEGHEAYALTPASKEDLERSYYAGNLLSGIRKTGGKYFWNYTGLVGDLLDYKIPWGITSDLAMDKDLEELNPLQELDVEFVEEFIFKRIANNLKTRKIKIDRTKKGTILLCVKINYEDLVESLELDVMKKHPKYFSEKALVKSLQ